VFSGTIVLVIMAEDAIIGAHQSSPCIALITLGHGSIVLMDASDITCTNTSASRGVLWDATFASSSASEFLFLSMQSTVKPLKKFSILLTKARYFSRVGSLAIHSFSIYPATTLESVQRMQL
jgi:hypothetical protein